ncbi:MAG TPA: class I SAM-dependent methyltransferase [Pirellulales bacterium]|nr:class I SAM-dependent methyltransferase [Pirellulales bacterium]
MNSVLPATMRTLREIGTSCPTDKVTGHGYDVAYERHFSHLRSSPLRILEIGVGGGGSLRMWEQYFPYAHLVGVDIDPDCARQAGPRAHIFIGDQADRGFLELLSHQAGAPFDIIIDDGGHGMEQQIASFRTLFKALRPGGTYVIEDLETSYYASYGGGEPGKPGTTVNLLKALVDAVHAEYHARPATPSAPSNTRREWTPLAPSQWETSDGTALERLADGSLLATGPRPACDTFTIKAPLPLPQVTALRIELLPDARLPCNGPGRADNGNCVLSEVRFCLAEGDAWERVPLEGAVADFEQRGYPASAALDGQAVTGWAIDPRQAQPHHIDCEFRRRCPASGPSTASIRLEQRYGGGHTLGRFRILVTADANPWDDVAPATVTGIHFYKNICFIERGT